MKISAAPSPIDTLVAAGSGSSRAADYGSEFDSVVRSLEKGAAPSAKRQVEKIGEKGDPSQRKTVKPGDRSQDGDIEGEAPASAAEEPEIPESHGGSEASSATADILGRLLAAPLGALTDERPPVAASDTRRAPARSAPAEEADAVPQEEGAAMPDEALTERLIIAPIGAGDREPKPGETAPGQARGKVALEILRMETHFEPRADDFVLVEGRAPQSTPGAAAGPLLPDSVPARNAPHSLSEILRVDTRAAAVPHKGLPSAETPPVETRAAAAPDTRLPQAKSLVVETRASFAVDMALPSAEKRSVGATTIAAPDARLPLTEMLSAETRAASAADMAVSPAEKRPVDARAASAVDTRLPSVENLSRDTRTVPVADARLSFAEKALVERPTAPAVEMPPITAENRPADTRAAVSMDTRLPAAEKRSADTQAVPAIERPLSLAEKRPVEAHAVPVAETRLPQAKTLPVDARAGTPTDTRLPSTEKRPVATPTLAAADMRLPSAEKAPVDRLALVDQAADAIAPALAAGNVEGNETRSAAPTVAPIAEAKAATEVSAGLAALPELRTDPSVRGDAMAAEPPMAAEPNRAAEPVSVAKAAKAAEPLPAAGLPTPRPDARPAATAIPVAAAAAARAATSGEPIAAIASRFPASPVASRAPSKDERTGPAIPMRFDEALARLGTSQRIDSPLATTGEGERGAWLKDESVPSRRGAGALPREDEQRFVSARPKNEAAPKLVSALEPGLAAGVAGNGGIAPMSGQVAGRIIDALRPNATAGSRLADLPPGDTHLRLTAGGAALKTLTIQLQPENLGRLDVSMRLVDGQLTLELAATEHETALVLGQDRDGLRKLLEHAGFSMDDASITIVTRETPTGLARASGTGAEGASSTLPDTGSQGGFGAGQPSDEQRQQGQTGSNGRNFTGGGQPGEPEGHPAGRRSSSIYL